MRSGWVLTPEERVSILVGSGLLGQHRCVHQASEPITDPASAPRHRDVGVFQFSQAPFQRSPRRLSILQLNPCSIQNDPALQF